MKIILTGVTGFIGGEVLQSAILHPSITSILVLTRKPLSIKDPKLTVIVQDDFLTYTDEILEACTGAEACVWSLGVAKALNPEEYRKINISYTITAARTFAEKLGPSLGDGNKFKFVYLSGFFTERDPNKNLWFVKEARMIRGEVETGLMELQEKEGKDTLLAYIARPGPVLAKNSSFPAVLQFLVKAVNVDDLAAKVLDTAINGHKSQIIEVDVLRNEGKALKKKLEKDET